MAQTKTVSARVDLHTAEVLDCLADRAGAKVTVSDIIIEALAEYLEDRAPAPEGLASWRKNRMGNPQQEQEQAKAKEEES